MRPTRVIASKTSTVGLLFSPYQLNKQYMDTGIKVEEARQKLTKKLRHEIPGADASFCLPMADSCSAVQLSRRVPDDTVISSGARHNLLVSSQHLPLHEVVVSRFEVGDIPFNFREESVFWQIVHNGNVELCLDVAVLVEPVSSEAICWFMPGDQLIAINDIVVKSEDEAWHQVSECKSDKIKLSVRPLAELSEFSVRYMHYHGDKGPRSISRQSGTHCEEHAGNNVWLVHETGFTSAVRLPDIHPLSSENCLVKLNRCNTCVLAKTRDLHQMNPVQYDVVEDLVSLPSLNESNVLHTLHQRYYNNLIHTYAGKKTLLIVNPLHSLCIYTRKVMKMLELCHLRDMPPHVYSIARSAYESLKKTAKSQSIVLLGYSGSGKTTNVCHMLDYFCFTTATPPFCQKLRESVSAAVTLLESFCNCQTILNDNATRCTHLFKLQYDRYSMTLVGMTVEILLMDSMDLTRRPNAESAYHVFYQFLAGISSTVRKDLLLESSVEPNLFVTPLHDADDVKEAVQSWRRTLDAMNVLGFTEDEVSAVCSVLAAVCHLGAAGAVSGVNSCQFTRIVAAGRAASVLGVNVEMLSDCVFSPHDTHSLSAVDRLENFVSALYSQLLVSLVKLVNRALSASGNVLSQQHLVTTVVDVAGFQNPAACGRRDGATFNDLCQNHIHERLHRLFTQSIMSSVTRLFMKHSAECEADTTSKSRVDVADLLNSAECVVNVGGMKAHRNHFDIFSLLSQTSERGFDDSQLLATFIQQFSGSRVQQSDGRRLVELDHLNETNTVQYNVQGWTQTVYMSAVALQLQALLHTSSKDNVKELFGSLTDVEHCTINCLRLDSALNDLTDSLQCSNIYFIYCLLPRYTHRLTTDCHSSSINTQLLRVQLRGMCLLDALRIQQQQGCALHKHLDSFCHEFQEQNTKLLQDKRDSEKTLHEVPAQQPCHPEDVVRRMKMKLRKAQMLISDVQQSCSRHRQLTVEANKQTRMAFIDVEDLQMSVATAVRARKCLESEVNALRLELEITSKAQLGAEERWKQLALDNTKLQLQVGEKDDEIGELIKKYKTLVHKNAMELAVLQDQSAVIQDLHCRIQKQKLDCETVQMRLHFLQETSAPKETVIQLESKIKELESRLSLEVTTRIHAETVAKRLKYQADKTFADEAWKTSVTSEIRRESKEHKQIRELQQQICAVSANDAEARLHCQQLEKKLRVMEIECVELSNSLELSNRRVQELQSSLLAGSTSQESQEYSSSEVDNEISSGNETG